MECLYWTRYLILNYLQSGVCHEDGGYNAIIVEYLKNDLITAEVNAKLSLIEQLIQEIPGQHGFNQHGPQFNTDFFKGNSLDSTI